MAKVVSIFQGSSGISTKLDPVRLRFDDKAGISDLAACINCLVDDTGRVIRRDGFTITDRTESWKNLFSCSSYGLGTKGDALCILEADMSYTAIRNVTKDARMSYVRTSSGAQDIIFYCNGYEKGRIIEKVSNSWPVNEYVGVTTGKEFYEAPIGHLLEVRGARMFIAEDNTVWYSEPNTFYHYRLGGSYFRFPGRIRMMEAVADGMWISDSEGIYFLKGEIFPSKMEMPLQYQVAPYPVREGTAVKVPASRIGLDGLNGIVVVFTTDEGICVGSDKGQFINLTERKIDLPSGLAGAGFYKDGHYICTLD